MIDPEHLVHWFHAGGGWQTPYAKADPRKGGKFDIVKGIEVSDFSRKRMDATLKELHEERDGVKHLLG